MSKYVDDRIRIVLFDHDDTLVGTISPKWKHHKYVAAKYYQKQLTDAEIARHWGKPFTELLCILYSTDNIEQAVAYNTATRDAFPKGLFATTLPTLQRLKDKNLMIGVVTATARFSLKHDFKTNNVPVDLFDYIQTAEDTDFHKPDSRVFEPAIAWLEAKGIKSSEVLYIGDGLHDMEAALGAGFSFVGVETGLVNAEAFKSAGVTSMVDLSRLIES